MGKRPSEAMQKLSDRGTVLNCESPLLDLFTGIVQSDAQASAALKRLARLTRNRPKCLGKVGLGIRRTRMALQPVGEALSSGQEQNWTEGLEEDLRYILFECLKTYMSLWQCIQDMLPDRATFVSTDRPAMLRLLQRAMEINNYSIELDHVRYPLIVINAVVWSSDLVRVRPTLEYIIMNQLPELMCSRVISVRSAVATTLLDIEPDTPYYVSPAETSDEDSEEDQEDDDDSTSSSSGSGSDEDGQSLDASSDVSDEDEHTLDASSDMSSDVQHSQDTSSDSSGGTENARDASNDMTDDSVCSTDASSDVSDETERTMDASSALARERRHAPDTSSDMSDETEHSIDASNDIAYNARHALEASSDVSGAPVGSSGTSASETSGSEDDSSEAQSPRSNMSNQARRTLEASSDMSGASTDRSDTSDSEASSSEDDTSETQSPQTARSNRVRRAPEASSSTTDASTDASNSETSGSGDDTSEAPSMPINMSDTSDSSDSSDETDSSLDSPGPAPFGPIDDAALLHSLTAEDLLDGPLLNTPNPPFNPSKLHKTRRRPIESTDPRLEDFPEPTPGQRWNGRAWEQTDWRTYDPANPSPDVWWPRRMPLIPKMATARVKRAYGAVVNLPRDEDGFRDLGPVPPREFQRFWPDRGGLDYTEISVRVLEHVGPRWIGEDATNRVLDAYDPAVAVGPPGASQASSFGESVSLRPESGQYPEASGSQPEGSSMPSRPWPSQRLEVCGSQGEEWSMPSHQWSGQQPPSGSQLEGSSMPSGPFSSQDLAASGSQLEGSSMPSRPVSSQQHAASSSQHEAAI